MSMERSASMWPCSSSRAAVGVALLGLALRAAADTTVIDAPSLGVDPSLSVAAELVQQAVAYEHGEGVQKDPLRAASLYCDAARAGNVDAQFALGWMYANGRGVARDDAVARTLFELAARGGHEQAKTMLAHVGPAAGPLPPCAHPATAAPAVLPSADFDIAIEAEDPFAELPDWKRKIADVVRELAPRYTVDPQLALAVIAVESNFERLARSEKDARGLMQLIPDTATRFNVRDSYNVRDNVRGGLAYLRYLLAYYQGNVRLAAAAYNAGEKAVDRHGGIPPFAETQNYVRRIQRLFQRELHPYDARYADPSPILPVVKPGGS